MNFEERLSEKADDQSWQETFSFQDYQDSQYGSEEADKKQPGYLDLDGPDIIYNIHGEVIGGADAPIVPPTT